MRKKHSSSKFSRGSMSGVYRFQTHVNFLKNYFRKPINPYICNMKEDNTIVEVTYPNGLKLVHRDMETKEAFEKALIKLAYESELYLLYGK